MRSLVLSGVTKHHGAALVIDNVSLTIQAGSRIGVVGPNGIGKSTLLRIAAGIERPDTGSVTRAPATLTVGYLPQEADARPGETLVGYLARRTGIAEAEARMEALAARLGDEPALAQEYTDALDRFLALGGDTLTARARGVCTEVGLGDEVSRRMAALSGGEAARAALAAILLARFDVFLLDEPTNDLDFDGLDRLESLLASVSGGVAVVSHDREFLDRTVTRILELEEQTRRGREYAGGWSEYQAKRDRERERQYAAFADYDERRRSIEALIRARRGEAKTGATLAKRTGGADRRGTKALSGKVRQAERALERLERVAKPWEPWQLQLRFAREQRSGDLVVRLERAVVERGSFRLGPLDLELAWQDRMAIVGRNGSGKTTLLGAITGALPLASGGRRVGSGVVFGELDQARNLFSGDDPPITAFAGPDDKARTLLAKFGLGADDVFRPGRTLSPGERTRAQLALLTARGVNCLVLDEPTNHLDLPAIEELETALDAYDGTILLVTHDRRFLETFRETRRVGL